MKKFVKSIAAVAVVISIVLSVIPAAYTASEDINIINEENNGSIQTEDEKTMEGNTIDATTMPLPTDTPSVTEAPTTTDTPSETEAPTATKMPSATEAPTATKMPSATEAPTTTKMPSATEAPTATKTPSVTEAPTATDSPAVSDEDGQTTTVDEYGNKHIIYADGSEAFLYSGGRKRVVYDSSFLKAYDINASEDSRLPKFRFLAMRCSVELKRNEKTGMITLTLSDYDKDLFDDVVFPEVIVCEIRISMTKQFWNTPIQGIPVEFITPDGTFRQYTDKFGSASFNKKCPVTTTAPSATATPSPTLTPTKTPTATTTPKPTKTPYATEEPTVEKTPKPTKTPIATEKPQRTAIPQTTETPKITESPEKSIFKDVSVSHWANENINRITKMGAFSGYDDGTFHPDNQITHEEFLKVVMALIYDDEFDAMPENYVYLADNDTSSSNYWTNRWAAWAQPYLTAAIDIGIVTADDIDLGVAETPITRGEMAKIISRAVEYLGENEASNGSEVSSSISDWKTIPSEYKNYIAQAYSKGILAGYNDGSFGSEKSLTRAEASAVVIRLIDKGERRK